MIDDRWSRIELISSVLVIYAGPYKWFADSMFIRVKDITNSYAGIVE